MCWQMPHNPIPFSTGRKDAGSSEDCFIEIESETDNRQHMTNNLDIICL